MVPGETPGLRHLLDDFGHGAGADRLAAFTDGEANALFHCHGLAHEVDFDFDVVARHAHFGAAQELERAGDIGRAEVELGAVA